MLVFLRLVAFDTSDVVCTVDMKFLGFYLINLSKSCPNTKVMCWFYIIERQDGQVTA